LITILSYNSHSLIGSAHNAADNRDIRHRTHRKAARRLNRCDEDRRQRVRASSISGQRIANANCVVIDNDTGFVREGGGVRDEAKRIGDKLRQDDVSRIAAVVKQCDRRKVRRSVDELERIDNRALTKQNGRRVRSNVRRNDSLLSESNSAKAKSEEQSFEEFLHILEC
jgi:hypothetical protein